MSLLRTLKHLCTGSLLLRRRFPAATLDAIENAIRQCESRHAGEIRFAVEAALPLSALWRGQTPRERALDVFAQLRVWDTAHNNGVLIYLLLADHDVEIVADRGVGDARVAAEEWAQCCREMESRFAAGRYLDGSLAGIEAVAAVLRRHPPALPDAGDELPNRPTLL